MPTYQEFLADQAAQRQAAQGRLPSAQQNLQQAQYAMRQANNPSGIPGGFNADSYGRASNALSQAQQSVNDVQGTLSRLDPATAENRAEGNRLQAYDLARGGVNRLQNDPTDQFIRQRLQEAASPGGGPFNETTRTAMFTNAMQSSGHDAQVQSIMESAAQRGLAPNDPSVQAALRRAGGEQAQAAQRARLSIDMQANPANYAAQQSAVNRLGDYNSGRQQQQQSAEDRLREMLWNEGINRQVAGPQVASVSWSSAAPQQRPAATPGYQPQAPRAPAGGGSPTPSPAPAPRPVAPTGPTNYGTIRGPTGTITGPPTTPSMYTMRGPTGTITGYNGGFSPPQPRQVGPNLYADPYGF